jgi:hypothetical protein
MYVKKAAAAVFAALLLILSMIPAMGQDLVPDELPVTYVSQDGQIRLHLPEGWLAEEAAPGEITLTNNPDLATASIITEFGQVAALFQIVDASVLPTDAPVDLAQMATFFQISASAANTLEFSEPAPVTISGQDGLRLASIGGQLDQVLYVIDLGDGQYATLIAATAAGGLSLVERTLIEILENAVYDPDAETIITELLASGPQTFVTPDGVLRFEYPAGWVVVAQNGQINFASSQRTLTAVSAADVAPGEVGGAILAGPGDVFPVEQPNGPLTAEQVAAFFAGDANQVEPVPEGSLIFGEAQQLTVRDRQIVVRIAQSEDREQLLVVSDLGGNNFGVVLGLTVPGSAESVVDSLAELAASIELDINAPETLAVGDPEAVDLPLPQTYTVEDGTLTFSAPEWPAREQNNQVLFASEDSLLDSQTTTDLSPGSALALVYAADTTQTGLPPNLPFEQRAAIIAENIASAGGVGFTSPVNIRIGDESAVVYEAYSASGEQALVLVNLGDNLTGVLIGFAAVGELAEVEAVLLAVARTLQYSPPE